MTIPSDFTLIGELIPLPMPAPLDGAILAGGDVFVDVDALSPASINRVRHSPSPTVMVRGMEWRGRTWARVTDLVKRDVFASVGEREMFQAVESAVLSRSGF